MLDLTKGESINLAKEAPGQTELTLGLGWNPRATDGEAFDLDATVLVLDANDKVLDGNKDNVVYFKNLKSACASLEHSGDNLTGEGDGDDEQVKINLATLPEGANKIKAIVNIYDAANRKQNFGQVDKAYARVFETKTDKEVCKYDLTEDYSGSTAIHIAEFYRHNGEWKFKAKGDGFKEDLAYFIKEAGL